MKFLYFISYVELLCSNDYCFLIYYFELSTEFIIWTHLLCFCTCLCNYQIVYRFINKIKIKKLINLRKHTMQLGVCSLFYQPNFNIFNLYFWTEKYFWWMNIKEKINQPLAHYNFVIDFDKLVYFIGFKWGLLKRTTNLS